MFNRVVVLIVSTIFFGAASVEQPTIFLVGDSTMADKPVIGNPERGWGQAFPAFFKNDISIENHAKNGRSTKSFIKEGRWSTVVERLHAGDFVLIQFGHNDAKKEDSTRFADAHTDYRMNLLRMVNDARSKKANPILITPVCRRRFDANGKFYDVHGDYPVVVRELAKEENIPLIDLNKRSFDLFSRLGEEETKKLFLSADSGAFSAIPNGKKDDTHFNSRGAEEVAKLVVDEIQQHDVPLSKYFVDRQTVKFEGTGKLVLLDNFYNNEWKKDSDGNRIRYHYLWHDSANSGFSMLGKIITNSGADIDTLCQEPTLHQLRRADIYIIVDPDTRQETENPNFIETNAANVITEWIKSGGVLVLLGNDKGNAEFDHLNQLAERFGIHFNEDSRNKVVGKDFATGTFNTFPSHPIFKGVRKIYIKELSTLNIHSPAEAIFSEGGDIIIAFSKFGKGGVLAVGDPWFYNEYMGTWRLPEGYDNAVVADNLFRWLWTFSKM